MQLDGRESSKWINKFSKFRERTLEDAKPDASLEQRVRVTVIDTGICAAHPYISRKWCNMDPYANKPLFCDFSKMVPDEDNGEVSKSVDKPVGQEVDKPIDTDGHGTFIAGLLLRLAPDIELSVARIGETREDIQKDRDLDYKVGKVRL
jgi:hypothetical protein